MEGMFKMRWILEIILLIYLAAAAARDIRNRRVALRPALTIALLGAMLQLAPTLCAGSPDTGPLYSTFPTNTAGRIFRILLSCLIGTLPGIFLLTAGWSTRQQVGYGDGIVLLVIGIYLGFSASLSILLTALLLIAPVSLFYIVCRKAGRKKQLPFVPFLFAGYLLWLAAEIF